VPAEGEPGGGVSGIVLAGGRSSRFGSDKLAEPVGGEPLLHRAVRAVAKVSDEVLAVASPSGDLPVLPSDLPVPARTIRDDEPHAGPLAALAVGLANADHPAAVVAGGDMPWLSPSVLSLLVDRLRSGDVDAAALELGGKAQPLPLGISRSALVTIRGLLTGGDRSLRSLLGGTRVALVEEPAWRALDPTGRTLADVDVPGDLTAGRDRPA
jgi:molybdopterin-guanine dinucleotide biosynthesis protein A